MTRNELAILRAASVSADSSDRQALRYLEGYLVSEALRRASVPAPPGMRAAIEDSLVKTLGYRDYVMFSEELRGFDLADLLAGAFRFIRETNLMYRTLLTEQAREVLGRDIASLKPVDLARLLERDPKDAVFPPELMLPSFENFLSGIGLSLRTTGGAEIRIDASGRPEKNARAACLPVDIPDDVRISVRPSGGLSDYRTLFHEGGHAVHFANAPSDPWELSRLGPAAVTEGVGALFAGAWSDPIWLRHYREFARGAEGGKGVAEALTDVEIARIERRQLLRDLYLIRRYAGAHMLFAAILHGADPAVYRPFFFEAEGIPAGELYRQVTGFAAGIDVRAEDAGDYTSEVDPFFYAADYVRGFCLAALLDERFKERFGDDWFANPETGAWLKTQLFAAGNRRSVAEVIGLLGGEGGVSFEAVKARLTRRFAETEAVIEAARR